MIIDKLDMRILKKFHNLRNDEEKSMWALTKELSPNLKTDYKIRAKLNLIKSRIKSMEGDLFKISRKANGKLIYDLIDDNLNFTKRKIAGKFRNCIELFIENKWHIFEL